jgi:hypothetical protein
VKRSRAGDRGVKCSDPGGSKPIGQAILARDIFRHLARPVIG